MAEITREDLATFAKVSRALAADKVRDYAIRQCHLVPTTEVDVLCDALGDVSVHEAYDFLDRRQRELAGRAVPGDQ